MSAIATGRIDKIYDAAIKRYYSEYMGLVFEQMCREYLLRYADDLPIVLSDVGQWWGTDAKTKKEVQIDIVGTPIEGNKYIIGSCKYKNEKIGIDELELLKKAKNKETLEAELTGYRKQRDDIIKNIYNDKGLDKTITSTDLLPPTDPNTVPTVRKKHRTTISGYPRSR